MVNFIPGLYKFIKKLKKKKKTKEEIDINILLNEKNKINNKEVKNIEKAIKKVMGSKCKIKWNFVKKILPSKSGKFRYTISEVSH